MTKKPFYLRYGTPVYVEKINDKTFIIEFTRDCEIKWNDWGEIESVNFNTSMSEDYIYDCKYDSEGLWIGRCFSYYLPHNYKFTQINKIEIKGNNRFEIHLDEYTSVFSRLETNE